MCSQLLAVAFLLTVPAGVRTQHYSWWSDNPQPYLKAIGMYGSHAPRRLAPGETIRAGIVTHHFLASSLMVRFFATLHAQHAPTTVILIGPNHYHHGSANISVSSLPWKTPFGLLETDPRIVQQIKAAANLPEDPQAFSGEHSVGVLAPFVKYYFPHSSVVPILVDINARQESLWKLRGVLSSLLRNPQILVVLSMDFSHHSTAAIADARDEQARLVISTFNTAGVERLNVDCPKGLWLLLSSLNDRGHIKVEFGEHTNSARLTGNPAQTDVTSYFSVYFLKR
jgi:MEMO1 family protein